jgi:ribosome-associated protein
LTTKDIDFSNEAQQPNLLNDLIIDAIQDIKGKDIAKFDMRQLEEASSDFFIICHGNSSTQVSSIIKNIAYRVNQELDLRANHSEGKEGKNWMLIDYFSVVVHVFSKEKRDFYNIEDLWSDAKITHYDNID